MPADLHIFTLINTEYIVPNVTLQYTCTEIKNTLYNNGMGLDNHQYALFFGGKKWDDDENLEYFINRGPAQGIDPRNTVGSGRDKARKCMKLLILPHPHPVGTGGGYVQKKKPKKRQTKWGKKKRKTKRRKKRSKKKRRR